MTDDLEQSPGLAIGGPTPQEPAPSFSDATTALPEPKRRQRKTRVEQPVNKLSLAERARLLDRRKNATYQIIFKVDEDTYASLVSVAEKAALRVNDTARRCFLDGLRRYADLPMPRGPFAEQEYLPDAVGDVFAGVHDENAASYRNAVATVDPEKEKQFLKSLGIQMST